MVGSFILRVTQLGYNALHYASFNGYYDVVEDLIHAGADVNKFTTVSSTYGTLSIFATLSFH